MAGRRCETLGGYEPSFSTLSPAADSTYHSAPNAFTPGRRCRRTCRHWRSSAAGGHGRWPRIGVGPGGGPKLLLELLLLPPQPAASRAMTNDAVAVTSSRLTCEPPSSLLEV